MFRLAEKVKFSSRGEILTGTVIKINEKSIGVVDQIGRRWKISPSLLSPIDAEKTVTKSDLHEIKASRPKKFAVGDKIACCIKNGSKLKGVITRVNDLTYSIQFDNGAQGRASEKYIEKFDPSTHSDLVGKNEIMSGIFTTIPFDPKKSAAITSIVKEIERENVGKTDAEILEKLYTDAFGKKKLSKKDLDAENEVNELEARYS